MSYTEYRSKSLKELWPKVRDTHACDERVVINRKNFSTWAVDDICAVNWKNGNPIAVCVNVLLDYVQEIMGN